MDELHMELSELELETLELLDHIKIDLEAMTMGHAMTEIGASDLGSSVCCSCCVGCCCCCV